MNVKILKIGCKLICIFCGILAVQRFCHSQTDGFEFIKLSHLLENSEEGRIDEPLLKQKFHYYSKGAQCYVFLGEDEKTILKFFRRPVKLFSSTESNVSLHQTFESYRWAMNHFPKESALLGIHFGKTNEISLEKLQIVDKLGIIHTINPNHFPFVVQRKAILLKEKIGTLLDNGNIESAKSAMKSLFILLKQQRALGMCDADANLSKNFGFIGEMPVHIDVGRLQHAVTGENRKLMASKENLQHWINAHYPQFANDFDKIFQECLDTDEFFFFL